MNPEGREAIIPGHTRHPVGVRCRLSYDSKITLFEEGTPLDL